MIYADYAATTPVRPEVLQAMLPWFSEQFGNPSSIHRAGRAARRAIENAREECADAIHASVREIFFTSGGTEADNMALFGTASRLLQQGKKHLLISPIEHHAVLNAAEVLRKHGFEIEFLPVTPEGLITPEMLTRSLRNDTGLVSIHYANNEIGTIEPISELAALCHQRRILFHTDAVQAFGNVKLDVQELKVDLLSVSGHKIGGPKGSGFLFVREGLCLEPLIVGGGQERNRRSGTENVPAVVGLGKAALLASAGLEPHLMKVTCLRDQLIQGIQEQIPDAVLNGPLEHRLCGNVSVSIPGVQGESLLLMLDLQGICASAGSACTSGKNEASHVLKAIGREESLAQGTLRFSLSDANTPEEIREILRVLTEQTRKLRFMTSGAI